jgi:ketosteroid isomerase-like protein
MDAFRRLWEAYGRGRREEIVDLFDDACELHASENGRTYRGHDGVRTLLDDRERAWKSVMLTYQRAETVGDEHIVVIGHLTAFDHGGERTLDAPLTCVARFRGGRVLTARTFGDVEQALAHAAEEQAAAGR